MDFAALYRRLAPKLTNYLVANGSEYAVACDIVQETFLRAWRRRDELDEDESRVSGLLWTIARNLRTDGYRRTRNEVLQDEIRDEDGGATEARVEDADRAYLRSRLTAALAQLPPLLREAYTMFQIQETSVREIARLTGASETLVKVRVFRAKEKLRALLADLREACT